MLRPNLHHWWRKWAVTAEFVYKYFISTTKQSRSEGSYQMKFQTGKKEWKRSPNNKDSLMQELRIYTHNQTSTKLVWLWLLAQFSFQCRAIIWMHLSAVVRLQWKSNPGKTTESLLGQDYWNALVSIYFCLFLTDHYVISVTAGKLQQANQHLAD